MLSFTFFFFWKNAYWITTISAHCLSMTNVPLHTIMDEHASIWILMENFQIKLFRMVSKVFKPNITISHFQPNYFSWVDLISNHGLFSDAPNPLLFWDINHFLFLATKTSKRTLKGGKPLLKTVFLVFCLRKSTKCKLILTYPNK